MAQEDEHLLDFTTAMRDFAVMFPTVSAERIEQVLRLHDGDVAATIDTLLRETQPNQPPPSYDEAVAAPVVLRNSPISQAAEPARQPVTTPVSAPPNYSRTFFASEPNTSQPAPIGRRESRSSFDNFSTEKRRLQLLKRENERRLDHVTDEKEARMLEDEQLALLWQHKELVRAERREPRSMSATPRRSSVRHSSKAPRVPEGPVIDDVVMATADDLKEKLKKLSKVSRQRLSNIASRFRSGSSEQVF